MLDVACVAVRWRCTTIQFATPPKPDDILSSNRELLEGQFTARRTIDTPARSQNSQGIMFSTTLRRLAQSARGPLGRLTVENNPYRTKKVWPPDFKDLTPQQQLRFEKKYKRRLYLAHYSPTWDKGTRMVRFVLVTGALIYALFFAEFEFWGKPYKPSEEIVAKAAHLFGIMDPDKRYERRKDAPR
uniref:Uncharacterized protein n=1 Tax=Bionectria ochroleuca TaxID=29856 RepID=A0A8H7NL61_BIOOC